MMGKVQRKKKDHFNIYKRFRIKFWVKDVCSRVGTSLFLFNPYEGKGNLLTVGSPSK
jgi:hypothetical protein